MKRKFMIIITALVIAITTFTGCSIQQVQDISTVTIGMQSLISDVDSVIYNIRKDTENKNIFSSEDLEILNYSAQAFELMREEYNKLINFNSVPDINEILIMWNEAKGFYSDSIDVIDSHRNDLGVETRIKIDIMKTHAESANISMENIMKDPSIPNISIALDIIDAVISTGIKFDLIK